MKTKSLLQEWHLKLLIVTLFAAVICLLGITAKGVELQVVHANQPWAAAKLTPVSHLSDATRLNLAIALPLQNQSALSNLLQQIYDPHSPNFHQFLTPAQFTKQFGPSPEDYQKVINFAQSFGLRL